MKSYVLPFHLVKVQWVFTRINTYTDGAWSIAHSMLWPARQFDHEETQAAKTLIYEHFERAHDLGQAFIDFCERIILMSNYIRSKPGYQLPLPAVWFDQQNQDGFASSQKILYVVNSKRRKESGYFRHYAIAAWYYGQYVLAPSARIFGKCRRKLLSLHANCLLQHISNSILHFNHINQ